MVGRAWCGRPVGVAVTPQRTRTPATPRNLILGPLSRPRPRKTASEETGGGGGAWQAAKGAESGGWRRSGAVFHSEHPRARPEPSTPPQPALDAQTWPEPMCRSGWRWWCRPWWSRDGVVAPSPGGGGRATHTHTHHNKPSSSHHIQNVSLDPRTLVYSMFPDLASPTTVRPLLYCRYYCHCEEKLEGRWSLRGRKDEGE